MMRDDINHWQVKRKPVFLALMQIIKNILLFKAGVIILIHSLVLHKHHFEMACEEHIKVHESADDIIDLLSLGFHQDATNNLEHFTYPSQHLQKKADFIDSNFPTGAFFAKDKSIFTGISLYFKTQPKNLFADFILPSNGLRAPPDSDFYL